MNCHQIKVLLFYFSLGSGCLRVLLTIFNSGGGGGGDGVMTMKMIDGRVISSRSSSWNNNSYCRQRIWDVMETNMFSWLCRNFR